MGTRARRSFLRNEVVMPQSGQTSLKAAKYDLIRPKTTECDQRLPCLLSTLCIFACKNRLTMEKLHFLIHRAVKRWADKHKTGQAADTHTEAAKGKHEEKQPAPKTAGHETIIDRAHDGQNIKKAYRQKPARHISLRDNLLTAHKHRTGLITENPDRHHPDETYYSLNLIRQSSRLSIMASDSTCIPLFRSESPPC